MMGIWHFSTTGNGEKLAKNIATELKDKETEIVDITSYDVRNKLDKNISYKNIIIIYPTYAGDVSNVLS